MTVDDIELARSILRRMVARSANPACMLVLSLACAPRGSLGRDGLDGTESGTGSTSGTSAGSTTTGAATGSDTTGAASSGGSESSSTAADDSTTAADPCAPAAEDDACLACRKHGCCEEWTACAADEICTCIDTCIADGGDPTACETVHCAGPNDPWTHLHQCSATACAAEC